MIMIQTLPGGLRDLPAPTSPVVFATVLVSLFGGWGLTSPLHTCTTNTLLTTTLSPQLPHSTALRETGCNQRPGSQCAITEVEEFTQETEAENC